MSRITEATLSCLLAGRKLRESESYAFFHALFRGAVSAANAKAVLLLLAKRGETAPELSGCLRALRRLEPPLRGAVRGVMDTCGTGGDGSHTINVSTLSAFVIAGAGGKVAKHGNRALSSRAGSSDLMEALGVNLEASSKTMLEAVRKCGIGYFHAPLYHPVFARVQPLRRALKVRTIFNLLGPLVNPVNVKAQMIGVSRPDHVGLMAGALAGKRGTQALICHSSDGMDEISTGAETKALWIKNGQVRTIKISPRRLGFKKARKSDYAGGTVRENSKIALSLLKGKMDGPMKDIVLINSGAGLLVAGKARTLRDGIRLADLSLENGKAYEALVGLKKISNRRSR